MASIAFWKKSTNSSRSTKSRENCGLPNDAGAQAQETLLQSLPNPVARVTHIVCIADSILAVTLMLLARYAVFRSHRDVLFGRLLVGEHRDTGYLHYLVFGSQSGYPDQVSSRWVAVAGHLRTVLPEEGIHDIETVVGMV